MTNNTTTPGFVFPFIDYYALLNPEWRIKYFSVLSVILATLCVIENIFVLAIIGSKLCLKKNINILIFSLVINDILHVGLVLAITADDYLSRGWHMKAHLCEFISVAKIAVIDVSMVTHTVIAIDRLRSLPMKHENECRSWTTWVILAVVWLYCWACSSPIVIWMEVNAFVRTCNFCPTCSNAVTTYFALNGGINLILPLFVAFSIYLYLAGNLSARKQRVGNAVGKDNEQDCDWNEYILVTRFCVLIMILFVVTSLPLQVNNFLFAVNSDTKLAQDMLPYSWLLAYIGVCLHPIMYTTLWPSYKHEFIKIISKIFGEK